jgi:hypothetical protein
MKMLHSASLLALAAAVLAGCSTKPKVLYHVGDERPPDFLTGPIALLLTNVDGYSAKLTGSVPSENGTQHPVAGDLLEREGSFVFQPQTAVKGKRKRTEGGTFFIWNETAHAGFVLSDPLQAYAPTMPTIQPTNLLLNTTGAIQEEANGHPCRRIEAVVQSSDGTNARFRVWQAEDAKYFPVRISTSPGPQEMVLNFSELRLELPAAPLFGPPDGFMRYDSPIALMNELIIRQGELAKRNELPLMPPAGPTAGTWRTAPAQ